MADRLRADGHEVRFVGTPNGPEARLAQEAGLRFSGVPARGFDRSRPLTLPLALIQLAVSAMRMWWVLGSDRPDVVVGFGGYVSLPVGAAALARGIPLVLHEQNSVPGMANKALSRRACAVGVTYPGSMTRMRPGAHCELTGNPVRDSVLGARRKTGREALGLPPDSTVLLVFGGSRGARHINQAMASLRDRILARPGVVVLHVAGRDEHEELRERMSAEGDKGEERYRIVDYLKDMGSAIAAADLIVARAGATSIAEITAIGRAAILVPYPYATDDHQTLNARDVAEAGGALVVADGELDTPRFGDALLALLDDGPRREKMAIASAGLGMPDAAERLARLVVSCARTDRLGDAT